MNYSYDNLGRLINKNINNNLNTNYTYITNGNRTSLLVDTIEIDNNKYKYDYDKLGNIINIYNNDVLEYEYSYDEYNQLLKENNYINNTTTRYKYDNYGNILYKKIYYLGTYNQISQNIYEYNNDSFKDLLTKFNNEEILYDGIGNPTNIGSKNLTWINGRQLQSYSDSINNITYKYNKDGIRTSKIVNNVKTMYELEGNDIVFEKTNNNVIYYIRSASELIGLKYNDDIYYYIKNNQNDIIGITDSNYNIIANYKYDSFGNIVSITDNEGSIITNNNHIAIINPFRYRCYYYDRETNLYYLNSRYYNPEWGRFINADEIDYLGVDGDLLSYNLFIYCMNNFVNRFDVSGEWSLPNWARITIGVVAVAGLAVATACTGGTAAVICGAALSGAITGAASGTVIGAISGGVTNGKEGLLDGAASGFLSGVIIGGAIGAVSAGYNVVSGVTSIAPKANAHGSVFHKIATNMEAGNMAASGKYFEIGVNKSLKSMGMNGGLLRPDVTGISKKTRNKIVEVVSPRQKISYISDKMNKMLKINPGTTGKIISWVRKLFR